MEVVFPRPKNVFSVYVLVPQVHAPPVHESDDEETAPPPRKKRAARSRNWCFTDFELTDLEPRFDDDEQKIRYVMWGVETCPDTNRQHHQGWVQFSSPCSLRTAKARLELPSAHFEIIHGSCEDNERYCSKGGDVQRHGNFVSMGSRTDITEVHAMLQDGTPMLEIANSNFSLYCRSYKAFGAYQQLIIRSKSQRYRHVSVVVLAGTTRCGKTRAAMLEEPYKISGGGRKPLEWFDCYDQEECLLIDDFDDTAVPIELMLQLLDGYEMRLPTKGGFTFANWEKVVITTNIFSELYAFAPQEKLEAFRARVTKTYRKFSPAEPPMPSWIKWSEIII